MGAIRSHLGRLAALILALQFGVIASATTALCCGPQHQMGAGDEMSCCEESGGAPHVCPLKKAPNPDVPSLKSCCTPDQQALAALFALSAVPEAAYRTLPLAGANVLSVAVDEQPAALVSPPDAPPPRLI